MKLNTRERYAVTAMLDLALHDNAKPCSLSSLTARQDLPHNYLEQLFVRLRRGGLVKSVRGIEGGYMLSRAAANISVGEVLDAINNKDKNIDMTRCGGGANCQGGSTCLTHHLWHELSSRIRNYLYGLSLADLVQRSEIRDIYQRQTLTVENMQNLQQT